MKRIAASLAFVVLAGLAYAFAHMDFHFGARGDAVAAWQWHDPAGWRVQAAIRRPGQARFDAPQTLSPPAAKVSRQQPRPWIHVAAGPDGRARAE